MTARLTLRERANRSLHAQREGFTMLLYMSMITLAVLVADGPPEKARDDVSLIVGTAIGTLAAHILAFRLASRYYSGADDAGSPSQHHAEDTDASIYALISATVLVVVIASLPYWVLPLTVANNVSTALLSVVIGASAWAVAKAAGRSSSQSLIYAGLVTVLALAIAVLKDILVH